MVIIKSVASRDVRFPVCAISSFLRLVEARTDYRQTSLDKTGSDGMNIGPDYSSAYCILSTDSQHTGHGMVSNEFS